MEGRGFVVILLGPPGVGKGTQGAMLADRLGWERIATGDLLRSARRDGTELGRKAQAFMDAGDLVPDSLIVEMVEDHLAQLPAGRGVIFDGFPRTVAQAEALEDVLAQTGRTVDGVLLLEAREDVLVRRISGRRSCPQCGRVYNVHLDPPAREGICDECGARLDQREDDSEETVRHRLEVYRKLTEPLVEYYERSPFGVLRVDGEGSLEEVRSQVRAALTSHLEVEA
jgi:adenylate kinase